MSQTLPNSRVNKTSHFAEEGGTLATEGTASGNAARRKDAREAGLEGTRSSDDFTLTRWQPPSGLSPT